MSALLLSACSGDNETAEFDDAEAAAETQETPEQTEAPEPELPQAESGLVLEEVSQAATVTETIRPERSEIITPADGEEFRILEITFAPQDNSDQFWSQDVSDASASLAVNAGGAQSHLHDLDNDQSHRILISAPQDSSTQLVVSSEGHDQSVDVLTGEREEDQIAAGYYRQVTQQDPNHTFPADTLVFPVEDSDGWNVDDTEIEPDYHVSSVWLAGWVDDGEWADSDEVWLGVE